jgi:BTB/POZ domain-containing protein KCTD9
MRRKQQQFQIQNFWSLKPLIYRSNQALLRGLNWLKRCKSVLNLELVRKQPFNKVEEILQDIPTWIFVSAFVFGFAGLALLVAKDLDLKSPRDVARELFQNAESIAVIAAVSLYFKEIPDRKARKHYEAWQVIDNAAAAKTATSYARKQALEDLVRDGVPLVGIDIPGSDLIRANLKNAILGSADLRGADLRRADLSGSILQGAELESTNLIGTNLSGADLSAANLSEAILIGVKFSGVNLLATNLSKADLSGANLSEVIKFSPDPIQQIKSAKNWRNADYAPEIKKLLGISEVNPHSTMK